MGDQLTLERTTTVDERRLVDRLVTDAHGLIKGRTASVARSFPPWVGVRW